MCRVLCPNTNQLLSDQYRQQRQSNSKTIAKYRTEYSVSVKHAMKWADITADVLSVRYDCAVQALTIVVILK